MGIVEGKRIYLSKPSWDCGWYWGVGYLGNKHCHYHLSSFIEGDFKENLLNHFDKISSKLLKKDNLDKFCELFIEIYKLRKFSDENHIQNIEKLVVIPEIAYKVNHINRVKLPAIFKQIDKIFGHEMDYNRPGQLPVHE